MKPTIEDSILVEQNVGKALQMLRQRMKGLATDALNMQLVTTEDDYRLMCESYYESHQGEPDVHAPHEAPAVMTFPLIFLSLITCTVFLWGTRAGQLVSANGIGFNTHTNWSVAITSTVLALLAIGLATFM